MNLFVNYFNLIFKKNFLIKLILNIFTLVYNLTVKVVDF